MDKWEKSIKLAVKKFDNMSERDALREIYVEVGLLYNIVVDLLNKDNSHKEGRRGEEDN